LELEHSKKLVVLLFLCHHPLSCRQVKIRSTVDVSGASHDQAGAAFFRGFPPFSLYKLGLYLEQTFKIAVLRSLNFLFLGVK
jgi:hypothetical protein